MSSHRSRRRSRLLQRVAVAVLALVALTLQGAYLWNAIRWIEAPDRGWIFMVQLGPQVVAVTRPLGHEAGLREGDVIRSLNGSSYETFEELWDLLDYELGGRNVYEIERGDERLTVTIENRPLGFERVFLQSGVFWILGTLITALGFLVFAMKPYHAPSWAFTVMAVLLGVMIPHFAPSLPILEPELLNNVAILTPPVLPATLLTLALLFPQRKEALLARRRWLLLPYAVSLTLAAVSRSHGSWVGNVPPALLTGIYLYMLASVVVFLASAAWDYLRTSLVSVRLQAMVILTGVTLAFLVPVLELVSNLVLGVSIFPNLIAAYAICLFFFPLSIGYAIARHDLFEISTVVRRTYGYILSSSVVVGAYGAVLSLLDLTASSNVRESPLFSVAFLLGVAFTFEPIHRRSQGFVDRVFYRQHYDYRRTIRQVTERMTTILDPKVIHVTLLETLVGEMVLENGVLMLPDPSVRSFARELDTGGSAGAGPARLGFDDPLVASLEREQNPLFRHDVDLNPTFEEDRQALQTRFTELDAEAVIAMSYQSKTIGLVSLGQKKSGKMFTVEDLDLIRTLTSQTAIALQNARLFDELASSLKQVRMLESIKANLSKFVPQTVQSLIEESPDADGLFDKRERDLTVMFADMTGYTRLSSQLPLDEVNEIVERYFGAFLDEILRLGGDVNETAGDGLMVLFQDDDPRAHARAAVRAALAIQRRTRELNAERPGQIAIGMHIGINSGTASVGATKIQSTGGMRWTYTASGPTTNVAARLSALGEEVAVTGATRERLGDGFSLEELGPQALKNVKEPVPAYRALAGDESAPGAEARAEGAPDDDAEGRAWQEQRPGRFRVVGRIREAGTGRGLSGLLVRAYDKDMVQDDDLGEARCDTGGRFEIRFSTEAFGELLERRPDVYLRVMDVEGRRELFNTRDTVRWNAAPVERFDLELPARALGAAVDPGV